MLGEESVASQGENCHSDAKQKHADTHEPEVVAERNKQDTRCT